MKLQDRIILFISLIIIVLIFLIYVKQEKIYSSLGIITSLLVITDVLANIYYDFINNSAQKNNPLVKNSKEENFEPLIRNKNFNTDYDESFSNKEQKDVDEIEKNRSEELDKEFPFLTKQTSEPIHYGKYTNEGTEGDFKTLTLTKPKYPFDNTNNFNDNIVSFEVSRIRNQQAINGQVNKSPSYYKYFYGNEFRNEQNKEWW